MMRAISFTHFSEVGSILSKQCADSLERVSMELGGHVTGVD
jgi:acyl-CoA reductase-like NAD-dependent aldehyde dehydrogenase